MKKSLLLILVTGFLLVSGLSGYLIAHRTGSSSAERPAEAVVSNSATSAVVSADAQKAPDAAPRMAVAKTASHQPEETVLVIASSGDRFQPIAEAQILDRRITAVSKDRKKRELLVNAGGKYPFRRVEETLVKNDGADTYTISARTEMVADHVLVKLQAGKSEDDLQAVLKGYGVSILRKLSLPGHYIVSLKAPTLDAVSEALSVFSGESNVLAYAEPDYFSNINAVPNDTLWNILWNMVKINTTGAWDVTTGSSNVVVAVIDTGVSLTHPDMIANLWKNAAEVNGIAGIDDDGNGYIDDINGWDFGRDDNDPDDNGDVDKGGEAGEGSHGTHCAGTIGAVGNNSNGVAGVCWRVKIMPIKAAQYNSEAPVGNRMTFANSDLFDAMVYAANNGANIISASYGGTSYSEIERAGISYAHSNGVLFVAAAGNGGADQIGDDNDTIPVYPASYDVPNIVSVAATDQNDALTSFSNYGEISVDLAAPGVNIVSTIPGGSYDSKQGTSMATPHVAGAAALLLSAKPGLTHLQLKQALLDTVDPVASLANKTVSGGRLNVRSLIALQDTDGDGMPDEWELANGLEPNNPNDASADPDSDHLNNRGEYDNRCITTNRDTDADTLWDGWEVTYGFNPNSPAGGLSDSSRLGSFILSGDAKNIIVAGSYAYVAAGASGLVILNVADPEHPVLAGSYDTGTANDVAVAGNYAYVADGANGLVVVNVSNPASPAQTGIYRTNDVRGVSVQGNYVYLVTGISADLLMIDVSNPALPVRDDLNNYGMREMNDVFVQGDFAYAAVYEDVKRYDLRSPTLPNDKAHYEGTSWHGWDVTGVHGNSSVIIAAASAGGVQVMDTSLIVLGSYDTDGTASGVFVSGNYVYVADGTNGLVVLDIRTPSAPFEAVHVATRGTAYGVFVNGDKVYVAEGSSGVEIFSVLPDSDGDGMLDSWETQYFGGIGQSATNDFDSDGISNWGEYLAGLNPTNSDQDADGLIDGTEIQIYNTDPRVADTDGDGLTDGDEISRGTKPLLTDTDGDGMNDGWEVRYGFDPLDVLTPGPSGDADGDGLTNLEESQSGTNPNNADTDGDDMPDGWEITSGLDPLVADALGDPDADGLKNIQEYSLISNSLWLAVYTNISGTVSNFSFGMPGATNPKNNDSDGDGLTDYYEITINPAITNLFITNPNNADTDGDGLPDKWEIQNSPPNNPTVPALPTDDSDGDGLSNGDEGALGTDITNSRDPVFVDDDGPSDPWPGAPFASDPNEDGSRLHPFDSIQKAITVATNGLTVLVTNGLYEGTGNYDISPQGKAIVIRSWNDRDGTVINTGGTGSAFLISTGETTNTVIKGFSLTTTLNSCSDGDCDQEDAIVITASSPLIQNCRIYECELSGIVCKEGATPIIENCEIEHTRRGIEAFSSTPTIVGCRIFSIGNGLAGGAGIGVYATESTGLVMRATTISDSLGRGVIIINDATVVLTACTLVENRGGLTLDGGGARIESCIIKGNQAPTYYTDNRGDWVATHLVDYSAEGLTDTVDEDENGAGILLLRGASPLIRNCLIVENTTWADDPDPKYNTFNERIQAYGLGGGIYIGDGCNPTGVNCTVANNHANTRGGGISSSGSPFLVNMISWGNTANDAIIEENVRTDRYKFPNLHCRSGNIDVWYSDIQYGYLGAKLSSTNDPLFVGSGDYHLASTNSPCFDKGITAFAPTNDLDGNLRPAPLSSKIDMGCYEFGGGSVTDSDGDGMPDWWENAHGLNPVVNDAAGDADGDGLLNLAEYNSGVNSTDPQDSDTDNDGMPDGWEVAHGLNPLANDSSGDPDFDGGSNLLEYTNSTDPHVYDVWYADSDDDGLPNVWENAHGLNPNSSIGADGAAGDPDSDGLNNFQEYQNGTDPQDADSDNDGLSDRDEVLLYGTNPNKANSDDDDLTDFEEISRGTNPLNEFDPVFVDDNAVDDAAVGGAGDPDVSDPDEDGSMAHPFDSIQEAIDLTNTVDGVTVLVDDGTYIGTGNHSINLGGKNVKIRSSGSTNTFIETHAYGPAFIINNGENTNTLIQGFTIQTFGDLAPEEGIIVDGSSPVLQDLVINNCELEAVSCLNGAAPRIINCRFYGTLHGLYADGSAGVLLQGSVVSNTIGRGIVIMNDDLAEVTWSTIENCAGGITLDNSDASIRQCIIRNNQALNYYTIFGAPFEAPILFDLSNEDASDTTSSDENGAGVLILNGSSPLLRNCLIVGNKTWADDPAYSDTSAAPAFGLGAGIYIGSGCNPTGVNCTVADNHANTRGGGLSSAGRPLFRNMIIWNNSAAGAEIVSGVRSNSVVSPNIYLGDEVINIWYSDIEGGYSNAVLSITGNPQFVGGGDYRLTAGSPCIDSGTYYLAPLLDLATNSRPTAATYPSLVDMGCYEYGTSAVTNPIALGAAVAQEQPAANSLADTDGDGFTDGAEITAGTDMYDSGDYFRVYHEQSQADGSVLIAWQSVFGNLYTVQSTDSLVSGIWNNVAGYTDLSGTGAVMSFSETKQGAVRYYRVLVRQP